LFFLDMFIFIVMQSIMLFCSNKFWYKLRSKMSIHCVYPFRRSLSLGIINMINMGCITEIGHFHCLTNDSRSHSMGHRVGKDGGVGNKGGGNSVSNWVSNCVSNRDSIRVLGSSSVAHIGDKALKIVSLVVDSLDTAVREVDRVRSLDNSSSIIGLSLVEGSSRVVISNGVVVGVGGDLSKVRGSIASGSMDNRSSVDYRGSMDNRGSMDKRGSMGNTEGGNSMSNWVSNTVADRVGNDTPCSVKPVGRVRDGGDASSESL